MFRDRNLQKTFDEWCRKGCPEREKHKTAGICDFRLKGAAKELLEYFAEKGKECSLDEVLEMAEKLLELKRNLKDDV